MKPTNLAIFLSAAIRDRKPVLITGAPGIGKSDITEQAAASAGADMILSHPAVEDPTDTKGLPWVAAGAEEATFLPFGELARALRATKPTVWMFDDLGQATPAVQASRMQLLLARRVNNHVLPDCVTMIAATNRRVDRAGVTGILEPVKSRFLTIVELTVDVQDWSAWALEQEHIPAEMVAFLRFRPDLLSAFVPSADLTNSPMPRTWSNAAHILGMGLPQEIESEALAGAVGAAAAAELLAFLRLYRTLPSIDGILLDPDASDLPTAPATLYAVSTALGRRATPQNFKRVARYMQRLMDATYGEFAVLLVRDAIRRDPEIQQTKEFVRLVSGEIGSLISGQSLGGAR